MGVIQNLQMNLDFMFNASNAYKGATKLKGSFEGILDEMTRISKKSDEISTSLGPAFSGDEIIKFASRLDKTGAVISNLGDLLGSQFSDTISASLDSIVTKSFEVASGISTATEEIKNFTAVSAGVAILDKFGKGINSIAESFSNVGIEIDKAGITNHLLIMANESEKLAKKFESITEKAASLQEGMNVKQLAQYTTMMKQLSDAIDRGAEPEIRDLTKQLDVFNYQVDVMNNRLPDLKNSIGNLFSGVKGDFLSALGAVTVISDAIRAQDNVVQSVHQTAARNRGIFAGQAQEASSFTATVWEMDKAVRDVGFATQVSMTQASEAMSSLAGARVRGTTQDLADMAITAVQMGQAFGISESQATELIRTLNLVGGLNKGQIKDIAEQFADVQATLGLTSEEASEAAATVGRVIVRMSQMGSASTKNAKIVAKEVAKMTASFTRAGMSANDATAMIDRFMDPTKLEDNAFLWHKMGMSVSDGLSMMTGDAAAMEGMNEKLLKAAYDLRKEYGNNPLALQAMAEAYGMTVQQVNQLSGEYEQQLKLGPKQRAEMEAQATLEKQAAESKKSLAKQVDQLANILNVLMQSFIMPLIDLFTPVIVGLSNIIKWFGKAAGVIGKMPGIGKPLLEFIKAAIGAVLLFTIVTRINLLKLLSPIKALGGAEGFGGLFSGIIGGAKGAMAGAKTFFSSLKAGAEIGMKPMERLKMSFQDAFKSFKKGPGDAAGAAKDGIPKGPQGGPNPAGSAADAAQKTEAADASGAKSKGPGFLEQLSKVKPQQLLALAVVLLAVGAAIFMIAAGFALLAKSLKELNLAQLLTLMGMAIIIMGGFAAIIYVLKGALDQLGKVGPAAALVLLAIGAAIFMIAAGFAILAKSIATLNIEQLIGLVAIITVTMAAFIAIIWLLAASAPALATASAGLIAFGAALLMIGAAIALVVLSIALLVTALSTAPNILASLTGLAAGLIILGSALVTFGAMVAASIIPIGVAATILLLLGVAFIALSASLVIIAPLLMVAGLGISLLAAGLVTLGAAASSMTNIAKTIITLGGALLILALSIPAIIILAALLPIMATAFFTLGKGMSNISENTTGFSAFIGLLSTLAGLGTGIALLGIGLFTLAAGLAILAVISQPLSKSMPALVDAINKLAQIIPVLNQMGSAILLLTPAFIAFAASLGLLTISIIPFSASMLLLAAQIPLFILLGIALGKVASNFFEMGQGAKTFAENIGAVVAGIDALKQKLDGVAGMSKTFVDEINKMVEALAQISNLGVVGIFGMLAMNLAPSKASGNENDNSDLSTVVEKLDTINSSIGRSNDILVEIRDTLRSKRSFGVDDKPNYGVI